MNRRIGSVDLTPRDLVLASVYLIVAGATAVLFAQAATGHLAAMHVQGADATVVDYSVTDDGSLELAVRIDNPTVRDVELTGARLNAYVDGEQVTDGTTARLDDVTIESGETERVLIPLGLREGGPDAVRSAAPEELEVRGQLKVFVDDELVNVPIDGVEVAE